MTYLEAYHKQNAIYTSVQTPYTLYVHYIHIHVILNIFIHQHMLIATNENKQRNNLN